MATLFTVVTKIKRRIEVNVESSPHMCKGLVSTTASGSRNEITNRACCMIPCICHFQSGNSVEAESALGGCLEPGRMGTGEKLLTTVERVSVCSCERDVFG